MAEYYTDMWENNTGGIRQMDWDFFYRTNYLNNVANQGLPADE